MAGNYDSTTAMDAEHCGCRAENPEQEALAHQSYAWTLARVSAGTKARLRALPFRIDLRPGGGHRSGPSLRLIHGAPTLNTLYWDANRSDDFARKMAAKLGYKPADLTLDNLSRQADGEIFWKISKGREPMPAWDKQLNARERWDLVSYIRTLLKPAK